MRKRTKYIALIVLGLFVIFCSNGNIKTKNQISTNQPKITVYDYQIWISNLNNKELRDSFIVFIDTLTFNGRKNYIYCDSLISDSTFRFSYSIERDSFFFYNDYCKPLDTVFLDYKNEKIEIIKSEYDVENSVDEECYIYWNKKYGLVSVYNYPWGALILFDHERISSFAKGTFYNFIINIEKEKHNDINQEILKNKKIKKKGSC